MANRKGSSKSKSYHLVKSKKQVRDVFGKPLEEETSEDCGRTFEYAVGNVHGLDMSSLDHRVNGAVLEVAERIASAAVDELGSPPASYMGGRNGLPYNFVLLDGRTLEVRFSRDRESGEGYPAMSGQTSWASFIEAFLWLRPGVEVSRGRDDNYVKEMFVRCWPRMLRKWMADMFIADVTVWAWASGVAGPGYVIVRQQDVGQDGDSLEERRLNLPRGLTGGDFRISKQEVPDWKSMSNEIKFYWNPQKGWITIGVFKVQRHRNCMQFGFRMLNLMMLLGVAARRTDRPSNMFECLSLGARKRWSRDRERLAAAQVLGS